jgi:hypothetical protein
MYHFSSHVAPMMTFLLIKGLYGPAQSTRIMIYEVLMSNGCLATSLRLCVCSTASVMHTTRAHKSEVNCLASCAWCLSFSM